MRLGIPCTLALAACSASPVRAPAPASTCASSAGATDEWRDGDDRATVRVVGDAACRRSYELATTAPLRDGQPANPRTIAEPAGGPTLRSGSVLFDALYALALAEARQASVAAIRDDAFDGGKPRPCPDGGCFETGRLWTYVWTRDTAYATDLGLATLDPVRATRSLELKLSPRRGGGEPFAIVQDTGSGGSWPISTDRVAWAVGAGTLLRALDGDARAAFARRALAALTGTIELDRAVAFDPTDGLYTGETSFLDWREQTYPSWTATDTVHIGMAKALSTNVLHAHALELAAQLAREAGDGARAERWRGWANELRAATRAKFWLPERRTFAAYTPTFLDPAPSPRGDLLATSLAILFDVADGEQARAALASYPQLPKGPPVVWPPVRGVPVYHNRASWPFVTAYELRAARRVRNDRVATLAIQSLVRGAALNLSNMENFEMISGRPQTPDGPVINSQRQLWSVAGYVAMVHDVIFGIEPTGRGLRVAPYVPRAVRDTLFRGAAALELAGYPYRGRRITITVHLPPRTGDTAGAYAVGAVRVDGRSVAGEIPDAALGAAPRIDVELVDRPELAAAIQLVDTSHPDALYAPAEPELLVAPLAGGGARVAVIGTTATSVLTIYRDGVRVASAVDAPNYLDRDVDLRGHTVCWSAEGVDVATGAVSHRAQPACLFGERGERMQTIAAAALRPTSGRLDPGHGRPHLTGWDAFEADLRPQFTGDHLIELVAANGNGPVNTGITCGVKHVAVTLDGAVVAEGYVVVPHGRGWDDWRESSFVRARLEAGKRYLIRVGDAPAAINMSALDHFAHYTGGAGGASGPVDRFDVAELRLIAR
jgi:hypothetical protein